MKNKQVFHFHEHYVVAHTGFCNVPVDISIFRNLLTKRTKNTNNKLPT